MTDTLHIRSDDADAPVAAYPHSGGDRDRELVQTFRMLGTSLLYHGTSVEQLLAAYDVISLDEARRLWPIKDKQR